MYRKGVLHLSFMLGSLLEDVPRFPLRPLAGTFITLDICIRQLEEEGRVDVRSTVERIRAQRAFSIQMPDQYVFCHLALLEFALLRGLLQDVALDGFDDDDDRDGSDSE